MVLIQTLGTVKRPLVRLVRSPKITETLKTNQSTLKSILDITFGKCLLLLLKTIYHQLMIAHSPEVLSSCKGRSLKYLTQCKNKKRPRVSIEESFGFSCKPSTINKQTFTVYQKVTVYCSLMSEENISKYEDDEDIYTIVIIINIHTFCHRQERTQMQSSGDGHQRQTGILLMRCLFWKNISQEGRQTETQRRRTSTMKQMDKL